MRGIANPVWAATIPCLSIRHAGETGTERGLDCHASRKVPNILRWRERIDLLVDRMADPDTKQAEIATNRSAVQLLWRNGSVSNPNPALRPEPLHPRYLPFWHSVRDSHPRLFRVNDPLGDSFAIILLTEAQLNGPLCRPPDASAAGALSCHSRPQWIVAGSGRAYFDWRMSFSGTAQQEFIDNSLGGIPDARLDWSRALRWNPPANDPNAGKAPENPFAMKRIRRPSPSSRFACSRALVAGQKVVQRNLNIQPTLTIRPGFPVRVIVNRDLILDPYTGEDDKYGET